MKKLKENIKNRKDIEKDILRKEKFGIIKNVDIKTLKDPLFGGKN